MPVLATDWATISSLATGAGTLVLAVATFAAVRSSNRAARIAESALREQRRPLLAPSRLEDPVQKIMFVEGNWVSAAGGRAVAEHVNGIVYLAISLRNVGTGIGVCQAWTAHPGFGSTRTAPSPSPDSEFRIQTRDLYIPAGDIGMWQGALRHPDDQMRAGLAAAIDAREPITIELLYSDQVGQQRTITRFGLYPTPESWLASMNRHWYLDSAGPRSESGVRMAAELIFSEIAAAEQRVTAPAETATATDAESRATAPAETAPATDAESRATAPAETATDAESRVTVADGTATAAPVGARAAAPTETAPATDAELR